MSRRTSQRQRRREQTHVERVAQQTQPPPATPPAANAVASPPSPMPQPPAAPEASAPPPLVYTPTELAHLLKVSRATVDRLHARGALPGRIKIGSQVRYVRHLIDEWLLNQSEVCHDGNQTDHGRSYQPSRPVHRPSLQAAPEPD